MDNKQSFAILNWNVSYDLLNFIDNISLRVLEFDLSGSLWEPIDRSLMEKLQKGYFNIQHHTLKNKERKKNLTFRARIKFKN